MKKYRIPYIFLSLSLIFGLYFILCHTVRMKLIFPYPEDIFESLRELLIQKSFRLSLLNTFLRCLYSFCLSFFIGTLIGFLCSSSQVFASLAEPCLNLVQSVPVVSIILGALFFLDNDWIPVFSACLMTVPVMAKNAEAGLSSCPEDYLMTADCFGLSSFQKFLFFKAGKSIPFIKAGAENSGAIIWKVVAAGEVLVLPKRALGSFLSRAEVTLESSELYAVTAVIVLFSYLSLWMIRGVFFIFGLLRRLFTRIYFYGRFRNKTVKKHIYIEEKSKENVVEIKDLDFADVYTGFNVCFDCRKTTAVLGRSGVGKSVLMREIALSLGRVSYMAQNPSLIDDLTVMENIMLPLFNIMDRKRALETASSLIKAAGLDKLCDRQCGILSQGQRQKTALIRAFAFPSEYLLLDEALSSQDIASRYSTLNLLKRLLDENKRTVILVSHDVNEAVELSDRIIVLEGRPVSIKLDVSKENFNVQGIIDAICHEEIR